MANEINFYQKVKSLDKEWSDVGMTADAQDLMAALDVKYDYLHTVEIKKAVEEFYQITL
jgi:hypothetical protein